MQNTSYTDKKLKKLFSDLVYHCRYNGSEINISQLFEHKSYAVEYPLLQLLQYIINIFESKIKEGMSLIPIIPVIFYYGEDRWKTRGMYEYLDKIDIPNFDYILTDISKHCDKKIECELFRREENKIPIF